MVQETYITTAQTQQFNRAVLRYVCNVSTSTDLLHFIEQKNLFLGNLLMSQTDINKIPGATLLDSDHNRTFRSQRFSHHDPLIVHELFAKTEANFFILAAAVKDNKEVFYMLPKARHPNIIHALFNSKHNLNKLEEGFLVLNKDGTFSYEGREAAYIEACRNGQLRRLAGDKFYQGSKLFSEDLF